MLGDGISGVLGQDFLSQFNYTLDYRTFDGCRGTTTDQIEKGVRLALEPSRGRFLVQLAPGHDAAECPVRLVPDSGANGVVLFAGTERGSPSGRCARSPRCACQRSLGTEPRVA